MKIIKENDNNYRRMKRALFGDESGKIKTFAIISAENPLGWKDSTEEEFIAKYNKWLKDKNAYNKEATFNMKDTINKIWKNGMKTLSIGHFNYAQIKGSYGDKEKTFCIFNLSFDDAKIIARNFGQESFFYGKVYDKYSKIAYYKTENACVTYKLIEITNKVTYEDEALDFFSKYGFKYRINMQEFGDDVTPIENDDEFEESLNDDRPFMSRASHRKRAYRKNLEKEENNMKIIKEDERKCVIESHSTKGTYSPYCYLSNNIRFRERY